MGKGGTYIQREAAAGVHGVRAKTVEFTEDGGTTITGSVAIPAGSLVLDIKVRNTVLWDDGTSATMIVGDDDDANGFFAAVNVKATDLVVGEEINFENFGGKQGVYLVAATGHRAVYYPAANNIIGVVTSGGQDGSAGRTLMTVIYVEASKEQAVSV